MSTPFSGAKAAPGRTTGAPVPHTYQRSASQPRRYLRNSSHTPEPLSGNPRDTAVRSWCDGTLGPMPWQGHPAKPSAAPSNAASAPRPAPRAPSSAPHSASAANSTSAPIASAFEADAPPAVTPRVSSLPSRSPSITDTAHQAAAADASPAPESSTIFASVTASSAASSAKQALEDAQNSLSSAFDSSAAGTAPSAVANAAPSLGGNQAESVFSTFLDCTDASASAVSSSDAASNAASTGANAAAASSAKAAFDPSASLSNAAIGAFHNTTTARTNTAAPNAAAAAPNLAAAPPVDLDPEILVFKVPAPWAPTDAGAPAFERLVVRFGPTSVAHAAGNAESSSQAAKVQAGTVNPGATLRTVTGDAADLASGTSPATRALMDPVGMASTAACVAGTEAASAAGAGLLQGGEGGWAWPRFDSGPPAAPSGAPAWAPVDSATVYGNAQYGFSNVSGESMSRGVAVDASSTGWAPVDYTGVYSAYNDSGAQYGVSNALGESVAQATGASAVHSDLVATVSAVGSEAHESLLQDGAHKFWDFIEQVRPYVFMCCC